MITQYNEATHKHEWVLYKWWDKTVYVIGLVTFWLYAIGFALGFVFGLLGTLVS